MWITLAILTIIILHVSGPFPTFFKPSLVQQITPAILLSSLFHGIVEEFVFRHCFWSMLSAERAERHRASLIWLNVLVFWLVHILLLYYTQHYDLGTARVYSTTTYNLSVLFLGMCLNAVYLESGPNSLANCVFVHASLLIVWSIFLGGNSDDYYAKYKMPDTLRHTRHLVADFLSKASFRVR